MVQEDKHTGDHGIKGSLAFIFIFLIIYDGPLAFECNAQHQQYEFIKKGTYYAFDAKIAVKADPECLLVEIFQYENILKYTPGTPEILLGNRSGNTYEITFLYVKFIFFRNESTWQRKMIKEESRIEFSLLTETSSPGLIPEVKSSGGYYQLIPGDTGCIVHYFQECELEEGIMTEKYIKEAKKEALEFLRMFRKFVDERCKLDIGETNQPAL